MKEKSIGHAYLNRTKDAKAVYYNAKQNYTNKSFNRIYTHTRFYLTFTIPLGGACAHPSRTIEHTHTCSAIEEEGNSHRPLWLAHPICIRIKYNQELQHLYFHRRTHRNEMRKKKCQHQTLNCMVCARWNFPSFSLLFQFQPQNIAWVCWCIYWMCLSFSSPALRSVLWLLSWLFAVASKWSLHSLFFTSRQHLEGNCMK